MINRQLKNKIIKALKNAEIKRSASPRITKGFHIACEDIKATAKYIIYSGRETYSVGSNTQVIGLIAFLNLLSTDSAPGIE